jgi:hypothetical protein
MIYSNHTFFTAASGATNGTGFRVPGNCNPLSNMVVEFTGTPASKTVLFEANSDGTNFVPIFAENLSTGTSASQTVGTGNELWKISLSGLDYVRCRVGAISGSCTCIGKAVI